MYNGMYNPVFNPMQNPYAPYQKAREEVTKVNGENGARAYDMGANSSALLLDESGLLVWLVTSDGAGYKTVTPYDITPHKAEPTPDYKALEERIARLEGVLSNANTNNTTAARTDEPAKLVIPTDE